MDQFRLFRYFIKRNRTARAFFFLGSFHSTLLPGEPSVRFCVEGARCPAVFRCIVYGSLSADGHLGTFQFGAVMNGGAVSTLS